MRNIPVLPALLLLCVTAQAAREAPPAHAAAAAHEPLVVSMTLEPVEQLNAVTLTQSMLPLLNALSEAAGVPVHMVYSHDATQELVNTRIGKYALILGPAQMVGSALRYGYEPLASFGAEEKMVFVALKSSGIRNLDGARGKRLGLPPQDSLATYMALGELNAKGIRSRSYFRQVRTFSLHESALYALTFGTVDVAVVEERYARRWLADHDGQIIHSTTAVPGPGFAIESHIPADVRERIRAALLRPRPDAAKALATIDSGVLGPIGKEEYTYVATLGYYTPLLLEGATLVNAEQARQLHAEGARLFDVRSERDYRAGHIKGAVWNHYEEGSRKEIDFDASQDKFSLEPLGADRNARLVFMCNGPECWKSYKASVLALKAGYRSVYWFRGGIPEWKSKGLPLE